MLGWHYGAYLKWSSTLKYNISKVFHYTIDFWFKIKLKSDTLHNINVQVLSKYAKHASLLFLRELVQPFSDGSWLWMLLTGRVMLQHLDILIWVKRQTCECILQNGLFLWRHRKVTEISQDVRMRIEDLHKSSSTLSTISRYVLQCKLLNLSIDNMRLCNHCTAQEGDRICPRDVPWRCWLKLVRESLSTVKQVLDQHGLKGHWVKKTLL